jgi:hypothetical protein
VSTATPDDPNQPETSRLERELAEILDRAHASDLKPPPRPKPQPKLRSIQGGRSPQSRSVLHRFPAGALWIFAALFLAIFAVMIDGVSPLLANLLSLAAVIAILMPIILHFRRPTAPPESKMWRGQVLEVTPTQSSPFDQVRQWWHNRTGR